MHGEFERVLPRLIAAYEAGRLVPFLGAGMSAGACHLWPQFVVNLERAADIQATEGGKEPGADPTRLIQRANRAVTRLKNRNRAEFPAALRAALEIPGVQQAPPQTAALAKTWWPLVLTTNYDDWFYWEAAPAEAEPHSGWRREPRSTVEKRRELYGKPTRRRFALLGRRPVDCYRLLHSLHAPHDPILWCLQGFVGGQHPRGRAVLGATQPDGGRLESELVVGHQEYRRVTFTAPQFRRAFAEVFRDRSLWFLGSSLTEPYFLDLFGEILEMSGPNPYRHYCFVRQGEADA